MVNERVEDAKLEEAFDAAVDRFAQTATVAVGLAKALIRRNLDAPLSEALRNEVYAEELALRSNDFNEGISTFMERPAPECLGE